ncbi:MAG: RsmE family RNA methyltransferase [Phycisphaerales bacterium]
MASLFVHVPDLTERLRSASGGAGRAPADTLEVVIDGDEARHAVRVRRAQRGQRVVLFDAAGLVGEGVVAAAHRELVVRIERSGTAERLRPRIDVISATPKGPRLDKMIDQLSQVGVGSWSAMSTAYGVVDPRETRLERMERIALESAKQSGRAWALELGEKIGFEQGIERAAGATVGILCDGSGDRLDGRSAAGRALVGLGERGEGSVVALVGPEGGFTPEEVATARDRGVFVVSLGPTVLRIETAAVVAAGVVGALAGVRGGWLAE